MEKLPTPDFSAPTHFPDVDVDDVLREQTGSLGGYDAKSKLFVTFEIGEVYDRKKSEQLGYPWYDKMELCRILYPDSKDVWLQPVRESDIKRFPEQYKKFKAGIRGLDFENVTPITEWDVLSVHKDRVKELAENGFHCVEQIAQCQENAMYKIGLDAGTLKKQAKAFLDHKHGVETTDSLKAKNQALQAEIGAQKAMIEEILTRLDKVDKKK